MDRPPVKIAPPGSPRLEVELLHRIGVLDLNARFTLAQPWTILFGPSGSGKSTILRGIAGLLRPEFASIRSTVEDRPHKSSALRTVSDTAAGKFCPPHTRCFPLATQAASLFPHLSVIETVGYRFRRQTEASRTAVDAALSLFRIGHVATRRPAELSGGEAQRVNLARAAVATEPGGLLLLDEPFTGLDAALRSDLMCDLQAWAEDRNLCVLSVTHDVAEAFQLGAEVIKIADGKVVAQGPVELVLAEERIRLLAQLGAE